jgi:oligopeptidase B
MACAPSVSAQDNEPEFDIPKAKKLPFVFRIHDHEIKDEYHWLKEKGNPDVINYLYAENTYADNLMKHTRLLQKKLFEEFRNNYDETSSSLPSKRDNYYYYNRMEKGKDYPLICRKKDSLTAPEEIVFDANEAAKEYMFFSLGIFDISPDHNWLIYGIDDTGGRVSTVYIKNLISGEVTTDSLPKMLSLIWANDNKTIFYITPEDKTLRGNKVFRHTIGTDGRNDVLVFEEKDKTFAIGLGRSRSKKYIFLTTGKTKSSESWFLNADEPYGNFKLIQSRIPDFIYSPSHNEGDQLLIFTNWNAINYKIMTTTLDKPSRENWKDLFSHKENVLLNGLSSTKDFYIFSEKQDALDKVRIVQKKTGNELIPKFSAEIYNLYGSTSYEYEENTIRLTYSTLLTPSETYDYFLDKDSLHLIEMDTLKRKYDPNEYAAERTYATASDGKLIPVTLTYKKGIKKDGSNPMLLSSYGSYGAPNSVGFSASDLSYLDRGFIMATAHIRGSNDLGNQWYEDGKLLRKKNTFTDFIVSAEHLINEGYTSNDKLAITGGSAGGLLMGAVVNMRPDLFKCVKADVPFVDVINTMLDSTLPLTTFEYEEWGNPNNKEYFDYMRSYSPYDNVEAKDYPTMLITGGYNDSQVGYWEPAKWAAKLREMKTDTNLLLLKISMDGGHGRSSGRYNNWKTAAFDMAFIMQALGVKENYIGVTGKVVDSNGEPLPFVNVYISGTTSGTSTNFNGDFYIEIKEGQKTELVFQSVGFKKHIEKIDIKTDVSAMRVVMKTENIQLKQVTVTAKSKDPSYEIIKNAIDKRKYHFDQANNYTADFYIKGTMRLAKMPEKLPKFITVSELPDTNDRGLLYLSESVARIHKQLPENFKEQMFSSKVAGTNRGFSWNRVEDVMYDFYKNRINMQYYADREFVSPIADGAMLLYKYKYEGTLFEDGLAVNKIKVIPRNNADPVFHGHIYIYDNTWDIHSLDLFITKESQLNFVDTLYISQTFAPVDDNRRMPLSLKLTSKIKVFGFEVDENYTGVMSNYQMDRKFPKKFFNNEVFKIEEDANKKDSSYWKETRPVLLTDIEDQHYRRKDSMMVHVNSKEYLDSLDARRNKISMGKLLLGGYSHYSRFNKRTISVDPLISTFNYNTVEGAVINYAMRYYKYDEKYSYSIEPTLRYGFASNKPYASIRGNHYTRKSGFNKSFEGGHSVSQFNPNEPITPFVNSVYTLAGLENFMKIYERTYIKGSVGKELINGVRFSAGASYNIRRPLTNNTQFALWERDRFTSNNPENPFDDGPGFTPHNALVVNVQFQFTIKQKYESYPNYKAIIGSKYPTFIVNYRKGIHALGSTVNYDLMEVGMGHSLNFGLLGSSEFDINAGRFFNTASMNFIDYKHFNGNQTIFLKNSSSGFGFGRSPINNFNNLPYYEYSTNVNFVELHYEHRFKRFFLSKIPLLKKVGLGEIGGFNAIYTDKGRNYQELFVGVENIFKVLRVDFVTSYVGGGKIDPQIRIGLKTSL